MPDVDFVYGAVGFHATGEYACQQQQPIKRQPLSLFNELQRRNVLRVGAACIVAAWLLIQVVETIFPAFGFGDAAVRIVVIVLAIGVEPKRPEAAPQVIDCWQAAVAGCKSPNDDRNHGESRFFGWNARRFCALVYR